MAKKRTPRKSTRRGAKDTGFEVEDQAEAAEAKTSKAGMEDGIIWATLVALLAGIVLAQMQLSDYGASWI